MNGRWSMVAAMESVPRPGVFQQTGRGMVRAAKLALLASVLGVAALFILQDRLLWHPRPYARGEVENFSRRLEPLSFHTSQGEQTAFYAPPRDDPTELPRTLWVVFAGNGSLVLDWDDILRGQRDDGAAFLLVDYPGYGRCEGKASPGSIRDNAAGAMKTLAWKLDQVDGAALAQMMSGHGRRLGVLGQSIGTGPALEFAEAHPEVSKIVLVSPYTSLREAARGVVGWPLCLLLRGDFDNAARLDALARRADPPDVRIFHGTEDTLVPIVQGQALAAAHRGFVRFTTVPGANHDDTPYLARDGILDALDGR